MKYAIILAGGAGSRLWPLSRRNRPKQFIDICSKGSPLLDIIARVQVLTGKGNIYLASGNVHNKTLKGCIRSLKIPSRNIFLEPQGKNTFAPVAVLTRMIYNRDKDALIAVLSSDNFIKDGRKFTNIIARAFNIAAKTGRIVTLGIKPRYPHTGYGYIKTGGRVAVRGRGAGYKIERFVEKPPLQKAIMFVRDKRYYWNNGIFVFRASVMLGEIKAFLPDVYKAISGINKERDVKKIWPEFPSISLDYAIMEKTSRGVVLPAEYRWEDLGNWQSLSNIMPKDKKGNVRRGNCLDIGSSNTLVWSGKRLIATLGLKDIVVVDSDDALLVCHKDKAQDVKELTGFFKNKKFKKYL